MKKLYRRSTVHPTPSAVSDQLLSVLPAAILTLTAALSPEDKEVLAYLISCSFASFSSNHRKGSSCAKTGGTKGGDVHPPCFNCGCFRCYMSYWMKWDASPNHQAIHEIIDAFEDSLLKESKKEISKRDRRKGRSGKGSNTSPRLDEPIKPEFGLTKEDCQSTTAGDCGNETGEEEDDNVEDGELEKGLVRKFVSFLGERIWGVWI